MERLRSRGGLRRSRCAAAAASRLRFGQDVLAGQEVPYDELEMCLFALRRWPSLPGTLEQLAVEGFGTRIEVVRCDEGQTVSGAGAIRSRCSC